MCLQTLVVFESTCSNTLWTIYSRAQFVINCSNNLVITKTTCFDTQETRHGHVKCVVNDLQCRAFWKCLYLFILATNHTYDKYAKKINGLIILRDIFIFGTANFNVKRITTCLHDLLSCLLTLKEKVYTILPYYKL